MCALFLFKGKLCKAYVLSKLSLNCLSGISDALSKKVSGDICGADGSALEGTVSYNILVYYTTTY